MKHPSRFAAWLALLSTIPLAVACGEPLPSDLPAVTAYGRGAQADGSVNKPFKAHFTTASTGAVPDPACGAFPHLLEHQVGEGESTHLGRFTAEFTFCIDVTAILNDGVVTEGESVPYWDGVGTFTAADGDVLTLTIEGEILPSTRPGFDLEFHDAFEFTGGTGRFAGAYGNGSTDSYVQSSPNFVVHDLGADLFVFPGG
ncbi:MAG TPA: hypothetical protein VLL48_08840 [Longimicrobiales bacterium]|nr:hypothetical protein [Longimicrobiales bacterium]